MFLENKWPGLHFAADNNVEIFLVGAGMATNNSNRVGGERQAPKASPLTAFGG